MVLFRKKEGMKSVCYSYQGQKGQARKFLRRKSIWGTHDPRARNPPGREMRVESLLLSTGPQKMPILKKSGR